MGYYIVIQPVCTCIHQAEVGEVAQIQSTYSEAIWGYLKLSGAVSDTVSDMQPNDTEPTQSRQQFQVTLYDSNVLYVCVVFGGADVSIEIEIGIEIEIYRD